MSVARVLEYRPGAIRYPIVGNRVDGFKESNGPWTFI